MQFIYRCLRVIPGDQSHPGHVRRDTGVNVGQTGGTGNGPGPDANHSWSWDQWAAVISSTVSPVVVVVRAQVRVVDARAVAEAVCQAARCVGDGWLGHPLQDIGGIAGVLQWGSQNIIYYSTVPPIPLNHQLTAVKPQPVMTAKVPDPVLTVLRGMDCTVGVRTISWVVHTRAISFNKVLALKLGWLAMLALGWVMPPPLRLTVPTTLKVLARVRPTVQWAAVTIQRVLWIHPPQKCALAAERRETM